MSRLIGFFTGAACAAWLLSFVLDPVDGAAPWQAWLTPPWPEGLISHRKLEPSAEPPSPTQGAVTGTEIAAASRSNATTDTTSLMAPAVPGTLVPDEPEQQPQPPWRVTAPVSPMDDDSAAPGVEVSLPATDEPVLAGEAVASRLANAEERAAVDESAADSAGVDVPGVVAEQGMMAADSALPLTWHPLWRSFYSQVSARGFARHMEKILARPLRIRDAAPSEFVVEIGVESPQQLVEARQQMLAATGLSEQESR